MYKNITEGFQMSEISVILKQIGGVVLVQKPDAPRLYCLADLEHVNELTTGQLFTAARILCGKTIADYGDDWPKFRVEKGERAGEVSEKWKTINEVLKNRANDLERLKLVFAQLKEDFPEVLTREKTQERLDLFNEMIHGMIKE